jgi:hypothetical protein
MDNRVVLFQIIQMGLVPPVPIYHLLIPSLNNLEDVINVQITVSIALYSTICMWSVINVQIHTPYVMDYFAINHVIQEALWIQY